MESTLGLIKALFVCCVARHDDEERELKDVQPVSDRSCCVSRGKPPDVNGQIQVESRT